MKNDPFQVHSYAILTLATVERFQEDLDAPYVSERTGFFDLPEHMIAGCASICHLIDAMTFLAVDVELTVSTYAVLDRLEEKLSNLHNNLLYPINKRYVSKSHKLILETDNDLQIFVDGVEMLCDLGEALGKLNAFLKENQPLNNLPENDTN